MPKLNDSSISVKLPLKKIISGGQTGADIAGLQAAKALGLETGGWMPLGFKTLDGPRPNYETTYGIRETGDPYYPQRTALNVKDGDGTVRFASNWSSPGELLTLKMIRQFKKYNYAVPFADSIDPELEYKVFRDWLRAANIKTLNVAGNSERTAPGIYDFVYNFLLKALREYV